MLYASPVIFPNRSKSLVGCFLRNTDDVTAQQPAVIVTGSWLTAAIADGARIQSFVSIAGWFHDASSIAAFYGGAEGVSKRLSHAERAVEKFATTNEVEVAPAYQPGNELAGMAFEVVHGDGCVSPNQLMKKQKRLYSWLRCLRMERQAFFFEIISRLNSDSRQDAAHDSQRRSIYFFSPSPNLPEASVSNWGDYRSDALNPRRQYG